MGKSLDVLNAHFARIRTGRANPGLVDGVVVPQRDPDDFSVLRVLGLQPGAHTVLLLPHDDWFLAKEMRVVLAPGETRRRRVVLTPR